MDSSRTWSGAAGLSLDTCTLILNVPLYGMLLRSGTGKPFLEPVGSRLESFSHWLDIESGSVLFLKRDAGVERNVDVEH